MFFLFFRRIRARILPAKVEPTPTMDRILNRYTSNGGIMPKTVFDVGAAYGTHEIYKAFPNSKFVLVEPLKEFQGKLTDLQKILTDSVLVPAAAGNQIGLIDFNVHADLVGSSIHSESEELESSEVATRSIPMTTLNNLVTLYSLKGPFFIKVDTQGHEWPVIQGSSEILKETVGIILEISLFEFFEESLLAGTIISKMNEIGFVLYDIFDLKYRMLDGALGQFDALFIPNTSNLRLEKRYATPEQRKKQDKEIMRHLRKTIS